MKIQFWGTRGSIAKPGPTTRRYGGNTSCVEVRSNSGTLIVIDCGTGAHGLGLQLMADKAGPKNGHLLISHTHWDHIQGIPFFAPLFDPDRHWDIYGPKGLSHGLKATLAGQMEHTYFPISMEQLNASINYHDLVEGVFAIEGIRIIARYLNHPALTLGYRIECDGSSIVYCCDHEPHSAAAAAGDVVLTGMDEQYANFIAGADLVIHDSQYTASEYPAKVGWGHSPVEYAVRACEQAGVKRLALTHHDPLRDDDAIDRIINEVRHTLKQSGSKLEVLAAAEGMLIEASGDARTPVETESTAMAHFEAKSAVDSSALKRPVMLCVRDPALNGPLRAAISAEKLVCRGITGVDELPQAIGDTPPALVLVEHSPPEVDGLEIARAIRQFEGADAKRIPIVMVTKSAQAATPVKGVATDWLVAPFSDSYARARIRSWVLRAACRWARGRLPGDEAQRLTSLRELAILDTPAEERFDRLTRIAATALNVPVALVSLVDEDRQWFKSCFGVSIRETSRDLAFCAHVVHQRSEMVVPDTLQDDRFADNPLVVDDPRIRAYTGVPLLLDDGACVGTLCAIDTRPRVFSDAEMAALRDLRDLVLEQIQQH